MKKYNEDVHVQGLLKILNEPDMYDICPAHYCNVIEVDYKEKCRVCWHFINRTPLSSCPCRVFDQQRAAKLTWIALEEKGYLE